VTNATLAPSPLSSLSSAVPPKWRQHVARAGRLAPALGVVALLAVPAAPGGGSATLADAVSGLLVVWCAVRLLRGRNRPLSWKAVLLLGAPVVGVAIATVASVDPTASLAGFGRNLQLFVLVPAALMLLMRDARDFRLVAGSVVGLALVQGAIGVKQYLTGTGASFMDQNIRAVGTFGPQEIMGMATVVSYGLVVAVAMAADGQGPRRLRLIALACAFLLVPPLLLSFSRGAWIATALACSAVLLLSGGMRALKVFLVLGAAAVVLVGGLGVGSHLVAERVGSIGQVADTPDRSVTDRYAMWAAAVDIWREHPVTGVGPKGFPAHRDSNASLALSSGSDTAGAGIAFQRQPLLSPHNMYLLILSEQGLLGLVALAGGWAALLVLGLRRLARGRDAADRGCGLAAVGLLVWQTADFAYADLGGTSAVLTALALGLAAWWALPHDPTGSEVAPG
jgi:O-antigen ligase